MFKALKTGTERQCQNEDPFRVNVTDLFNVSTAPPSFKVLDDRSLGDRNELGPQKQTQQSCIYTQLLFNKGAKTIQWG